MLHVFLTCESRNCQKSHNSIKKNVSPLNAKAICYREQDNVDVYLFKEHFYLVMFCIIIF